MRDALFVLARRGGIYVEVLIYTFFFLILLVISCCAGFDVLASSAFTLTKLGDFFLRIHVLVFFT